MNNIPAAKIRMLKLSIRCFTFGLLSLLPGIGLGFALLTLWLSGRVRRHEKQFWNAAKPYRILGVICAALCAVFWSLLGLLLIYRACCDYGM